MTENSTRYVTAAMTAAPTLMMSRVPVWRRLRRECCLHVWTFFDSDLKFPERVQQLQSWLIWKVFFTVCFFFFFLSVPCVQILEEGHVHKQHLLQNRSIAEWTSQHVARWLVGIHLEHHIPEFTAQNINGEQLLQLESPELKASFMPQLNLNLDKNSFHLEFNVN